MTIGSLETFFPAALPERWARVVGTAGLDALATIGAKLDGAPAQKALMTPAPATVLRAFDTPPENVRCLIVGQDPYPGEFHASGLAFSVEKTVTPLPPSVRNILQELRDDLGVPVPSHGDLSGWADNGVLLLNRHLTTAVGMPGGHRSFGWTQFTDAIVKGLVSSGQFFVAVLWGQEAKELSNLLGATPVVESAHPSPLSARRGFFGSKPFSTVNRLREDAGFPALDWSLNGVN
jgi:uracil-DNA glycosylase